MGTPLGPKYIPHTYMDPLGLWCRGHPNELQFSGLELTNGCGGRFPQVVYAPVDDNSSC